MGEQKEHSLVDYKRAPDIRLEPKDFLVVDNRMRLERIILALMLCGTIFGVLGIVLVAISDDAASSNINFLGVIEVSTGSVGIASFAIGAGLIGYGLKLFVGKWK